MFLRSKMRSHRVFSFVQRKPPTFEKSICFAESLAALWKMQTS